MKKGLSVILPTYDEAGNIEALIQEISLAVRNLHEVIVVDDNSPDGTANIVEKMIHSGRYPFLRLEKRYKDRGLTNSIWHGIELSTGNVVGWMDCDLSMPPKYLPVLLGLIKADYDIAVGSRFVLGGVWKNEKNVEGDTMLTVVLSRLMNLFIQICLDHRFRDYTSGFVVARKEVFAKIKLKGDYGEYFIDFIYRALKLKYKVVEIPFVWRNRECGYSKSGTNFLDYCRRGIPYITTTLRLLFLTKYDS